MCLCIYVDAFCSVELLLLVDMRCSLSKTRYRFPPRTETFVENSKDSWTRKIQQNVLLQGSRVRK